MMMRQHEGSPGSQPDSQVWDDSRYPPTSPSVPSIPFLALRSQETTGQHLATGAESETRSERACGDTTPTRPEFGNPPISTRGADQQNEVLNCVKSLGEWLERDISSRQELRAVLDRLANGLGQLNSGSDARARPHDHADNVGRDTANYYDGDTIISDHQINRLAHIPSLEGPSSPIDAVNRHSVAFSLPAEYASEAIPRPPQRISFISPSPANNRASYQSSRHAQENQQIRRSVNRESLASIIASPSREHSRLFPQSPIVIVNPFQVQPHPTNKPNHDTNVQDDMAHGPEKDLSSLPFPVMTPTPTPRLHQPNSWFTFLADTILRQLYLHLLLRLPSLYFTRVTRIFENAELSIPEIRDMASNVQLESRRETDAITWTGGRAGVHSAIADFKRDWESFVRSLVKEWKTLNIVSVLLLSAILTILQIQNTVDDPIIRTAALLSLVCALMSLLYGCVYIVRFSTMKRMHKAASWVEESQKRKTNILWNVWVFLAMPAIWLSWSILLFVVCILAFVWQTNHLSNSASMSSDSALGPQIAITVVLSIGMVYFVMIVKTLNRYGSRMDKEWTAKLMKWRAESSRNVVNWRHSAMVAAELPLLSRSEQIYGHAIPPCFSHTLDASAPYPSFPTLKLIPDMNVVSPDVRDVPAILVDRDVHREDWELYIHDVSLAWAEKFRITADISIKNRQDAVVDLVNLWNDTFFLPRAVEVVFCLEVYNDHSETDAGSPYDHRHSLNQRERMMISPTWKTEEKYTLYLTHAPQGHPRHHLQPAHRDSTPDWLKGVMVPPNIQRIQPLTGNGETHEDTLALDDVGEESSE